MAAAFVVVVVGPGGVSCLRLKPPSFSQGLPYRTPCARRHPFMMAARCGRRGQAFSSMAARCGRRGQTFSSPGLPCRGYQLSMASCSSENSAPEENRFASTTFAATHALAMDTAMNSWHALGRGRPGLTPRSFPCFGRGREGPHAQLPAVRQGGGKGLARTASRSPSCI